MPAIVALPAAQVEPRAPTCDARQLRLSVQPGAQSADPAARPGLILSIRNLGPDCSVPALPTVAMRDMRGRPISASRRSPIGLRPGRVLPPVFIGGGHRATIEIGWSERHEAGPGVGVVTVRFGRQALNAAAGRHIPPLHFGQVRFDQAPLHAEKGMAEG